MPEEIKPSFSLKYFILTLFTAAIVAVVGLGINYIALNSKKEIMVIEGIQIDLIRNFQLPEDKITAIYYFKNDPKRKIESLFKKGFIVKNNGNEGIENLEITFSLAEEDAALVETPDITSKPKDIIHAIEVIKDQKLSNQHKHVWNVSLLNPSESIIFDYNVYSESKIKQITFQIFPRKKDWEVTYNTIIDDLKKKMLTDAIKDIIIATLAIGALFAVIELLCLLIYLKEWKKNPEVRAIYITFKRYFNQHYPPPIKQLFKK